MKVVIYEESRGKAGTVTEKRKQSRKQSRQKKTRENPMGIKNEDTNVKIVESKGQSKNKDGSGEEKEGEKRGATTAGDGEMVSVEHDGKNGEIGESPSVKPISHFPAWYVTFEEPLEQDSHFGKQRGTKERDRGCV